MATFIFEGSKYNALEEETILDCLLRKGVQVTNSCKSGICHSCLLKTNSKVDEPSQKGLSASKKEAGLFLSCQQKAYNDLEVFRPDTLLNLTEGKIISQTKVTNSVAIVEIETTEKYKFRAGQFTNIIRKDGLCRSYSIASQTDSPILQFHVRKVPGGEFSSWLYDEDIINEPIKLSESLGECCLTKEMEGKDLLLIGVGTGLAPLYGVLKDSIVNRRMGKIRLLHGGLTIENLYFIDKLKAIEQEYDFFSYHPVFLKGDEMNGFIKGNLIDLIKDFDFDKTNTVVMICGDPQLVKSLKQEVFLAGVSSKQIFSDPFVTQSMNG